MKTLSIWHLLWRMIRYAFGLYLLDSFLWILIMGLPAVPGLIIREFFNTLTGENVDRSTLLQSPLMWVALLLTVGIARIVAIFAGRITKTQHRFTMSALLRCNLLGKLFQRPGAESFSIEGKAVSPGEVISFFREDAAQVEDAVVGTNEIFGAGVFALVSLIILFSVDANLTLLVFLPLVAIALVIQYTKTRIKRYRSASRHATQQVTGLLGEMFTAVQAIQIAGAEATVLNQLDRLGDQRRQHMVQDQVFTAVLQSGLENLVSLGTGLILLAAAQGGGGSALAETLHLSEALHEPARPLNVGDFALFVYYLAFVTDFLWFLSSFLALTKQTEVAFERMDTLLGENRSAGVEEIVEYVPLYLPNLRGQTTELPVIAQPHRDSSLQELRAIRLTYRFPGNKIDSQPQREFGITDINLTLKRGSLTVITGRVGSGKTTLLRVLLGLLPMQSGEIYWNGSLVEHPDQFFVPPRSAYTPQVPQLFSNTLQENLLLGLHGQEEELREAIALAVLDHDLASLPEGLNTLIGSKGMRLSGGQQQRTAAARMFIRQPELLVFDDLSSALDIETEQKLWARLFALKRFSPLFHSHTATLLHHYAPTYLIVSHRPFVLRQADHIIVLKDGRVEAEGKPEDLDIV